MVSCDLSEVLQLLLCTHCVCLPLCTAAWHSRWKWNTYPSLEMPAGSGERRDEGGWEGGREGKRNVK